MDKQLGRKMLIAAGIMTIATFVISTYRDPKLPTEYLEQSVAAQEPKYISGIKKITDIPGGRCTIYELQHEGHMFLITQCADAATMVHSVKVY